MSKIAEYDNIDICMRKVNKMEAFADNNLQDTVPAKIAAKLMCDYSIGDEWCINELVKELAKGPASRPTSDDNTVERQQFLEDVKQGLDSKEPDWSKESAHDQVASLFLIQMITPTVCLLREFIFGSIKAPFEDYDSMIAWMARQLATAEGQGTLWFLQRKAAEMSQITNFTAKSIMEYILLNWEPILHKLAIVEYIDVHKMPATEETIRNPWVTVHFLSDLSFKELRDLYKKLRAFFGVRRKKNMGEADFELYGIVLERGGPPAKGIVSFWESIQEVWNKRHNENPYETWKGVQKAYNRILEKLRGRYLVTSSEFEQLKQTPKPEMTFEWPEVLRRDLEGPLKI